MITHFSLPFISRQDLGEIKQNRRLFIHRIFSKVDNTICLKGPALLLVLDELEDGDGRHRVGGQSTAASVLVQHRTRCHKFRTVLYP
jgi:hypothetical protein